MCCSKQENGCECKKNKKGKKGDDLVRSKKSIVAALLLQIQTQISASQSDSSVKVILIC